MGGENSSSGQPRDPNRRIRLPTWCELATVAPWSTLTPRVLVVDDSDTIRSLIVLNLSWTGSRCTRRTTGRSAWTWSATLHPDVITLDVAMPRAQRLRRGRPAAVRPATRPQIPIVMVTARAQGTDLSRGAEIGVDAYVTKPFEPDNLVDVVRSVAAGRAPHSPR